MATFREILKDPEEVNALVKLVNSIANLIVRLTGLVKSFFKKKPTEPDAEEVSIPSNKELKSVILSFKKE